MYGCVCVCVCVCVCWGRGNRGVGSNDCLIFCSYCEPFNHVISHHLCNIPVLVAQLCPVLCDPVDCSQPGSSVLGILQARILEWVAMPSSRRSSWPRDQTQVSHIAGRFLTIWATREAQNIPLRSRLLSRLLNEKIHMRKITWLGPRPFSIPGLSDSKIQMSSGPAVTTEFVYWEPWQGRGFSGTSHTPSHLIFRTIL